MLDGLSGWLGLEGEGSLAGDFLVESVAAAGDLDLEFLFDSRMSASFSRTRGSRNFFESTKIFGLFS